MTVEESKKLAATLKELEARANDLKNRKVFHGEGENVACILAAGLMMGKR